MHRRKRFLIASAEDISGLPRDVCWVLQHYRIKQCYLPSPSVYYKYQRIVCDFVLLSNYGSDALLMFITKNEVPTTLAVFSKHTF